jgi:hypothetical protein
MDKSTLSSALNGFTSEFEIAFAEFLAKQTKLKPEDRKTFKEIVAKLSASKSQGHSCKGRLVFS